MTNTTNTERLVEALKNVTSHLVAAHSLLKRGGKKAAASDTMFEVMLRDYEKSFEIGRTILAEAEGQAVPQSNLGRAAAAVAEPDMRHPKIQQLIGSISRRNIEIRLVEQILDDPLCELSAADMEYWGPLHDKLRDRLITANTTRLHDS